MAAIAAAGVYKYTSESAAELDSHGNIIVIGNQTLVIQDTENSADVNAFSSDIQRMSEVPVVDAVVAYDFPHLHLGKLLIGHVKLFAYTQHET